MGAVFALLIALGLVVFVWLGAGVIGFKALFAVVIPYAAFLVFLGGIIYRIVEWAKVPVPFRIVTTCGQQKSLKWVKRSRLESPFNNFEVAIRMALEVFAFRSLFRNLKAELKGPNLLYGSSKWLWLGAIAFHYCFLIILIRHLRFFTYPVPGFIGIIEQVDAFLHIGLPFFYITDGVILVALTYLLLRRLSDPKLRYISLGSDFMPLFLILGLVISGILMRYFFRVDLFQVKEFTMGLVHFSPKVPDVGVIFYIHLTFLCALMAYFPFSKLVHMAGVFFSPTRNLANNSRAKRHEPAPWWQKPKFKTYCEWQEEFKEQLEQSGQPIDEDCYKKKEA
ncbi:Nitrate reductase gamma subunit [Thermodesulfatator indicus DSM 15286]|uniref:Nitrate reductase gamma subunit n=1 Tax=Thermodesulfatator indicus (strain DSM 15286 / JCM 11887 / CIR29812) TaxID=667014 RepID=F8AAI9_THEID|nr:sulfate reduction electron transfer complex DsrMKJOP subunit DsrM [Thermodesulfatator indicus]AEH45410.1 Nitrate reductase gamma subunit [Thermodesulfatator indicus DSM 15286]